MELPFAERTMLGRQKNLVEHLWIVAEAATALAAPGHLRVGSCFALLARSALRGACLDFCVSRLLG